MNKLRILANLLIVLLLLATVAVNRDSKLLGKRIEDWGKAGNEQKAPSVTRTTDDGQVVINTSSLAKDAIGYAGPTPVEIYIKDGKIEKIEPLENTETPRFFSRVLEAGILQKWNGLTPQQATSLEVDAVSGATYSSTALITNVKAGLAYAANNADQLKAHQWLTLKNIAAILTIALGLFAAFFNKSKRFRYLILGLNVVVLGFWCGSFLSLSLLVGWLSSGVNLSMALIPITLCIVAIVLPFMNKKAHYCTWHCPMGAAQELVGKAVKHKIAISPKVLKYLKYSGDAILALLLLTMWLGVGFQIMDYEIFSAFLFWQADVVVIALAILFLIISCFINRPYCRFVCPTGTLIRWYNKSK